MSFLLDSDTCSAHLRRPSGLMHRFVQHSGRLYTSAVCLGELYSGAYHLPDPTPLLEKITKLTTDLVVISFDAIVAEKFGQVRGSRGISVPQADLMIAATALAHDLTLVTHNAHDYRHIPGLRLDDWLQP